MLDGQARRLIIPVLDPMGRGLAKMGITANLVTYAGFVLGLAAMAAIATRFYVSGLVLILLSRLCDGLDGAVARAGKQTDYGGFIDIVLDFAFYGGVPLSFALADPGTNALPAAVLLLSFYVNGSSFLAYAVMAEKRALTSVERGRKSLFFTTGLAEATETLAVFVAACLFPSLFPPLAYVFSAICLYTALARILLARREFR